MTGCGGRQFEFDEVVDATSTMCLPRVGSWFGENPWFPVVGQSFPSCQALMMRQGYEIWQPLPNFKLNFGMVICSKWRDIWDHVNVPFDSYKRYRPVVYIHFWTHHGKELSTWCTTQVLCIAGQAYPNLWIIKRCKGSGTQRLHSMYWMRTNFRSKEGKYAVENIWSTTCREP